MNRPQGARPGRVRWWRVDLPVSPVAAEMAAWLLGGTQGCTGIETLIPADDQGEASPVLVRAYYPSRAAAGQAAREARAGLTRWAAQVGLAGRHVLGGPGAAQAVWLDVAAWRQAWAETLQPVRAGAGVVKARGGTGRALRGSGPRRGAGTLYRVVIPPGMAFGTGHHPTTRQALWCLELALKEMTRGGAGSLRPALGPPDSAPLVVDIGTGSGLLAIAARMLGAGRVVAVDTDPLAIRIARQNARRNRTGGIVFRQGSVEAAAARGGWRAAQVVVANLLAETLVELAGSLARLLSGGGILIGAGITPEKAAAVARAFEQEGLLCEAVGEWGGWAWVAARRAPGDGVEPAAGSG